MVLLISEKAKRSELSNPNRNHFLSFPFRLFASFRSLISDTLFTWPEKKREKSEDGTKRKRATWTMKL